MCVCVPPIKSPAVMIGCTRLFLVGVPLLIFLMMITNTTIIHKQFTVLTSGSETESGGERRSDITVYCTQLYLLSLSL